MKLYNKKTVSYTDDHGSSDEQCSKCKFFVSPASCKIVIGKISPDGWCNKFKRSEGAEREKRLEGQAL